MFAVQINFLGDLEELVAKVDVCEQSCLMDIEKYAPTERLHSF